MADDARCMFYQQLVQHLRDSITSDTTKEDAERILVSVAEQEGSVEDRTFFHENAETIFEFLQAEELDPRQICVALGVCPQ